MRYLKLCLITLFFGFGTPVISGVDEQTSAFVKELGRDGYSNIAVKRRWFGRVQVTGTKGSLTRAIMIRSRTGEVIKDVVTQTPQKRPRDPNSLPDGTGLSGSSQPGDPDY